MFKSVYMHLYAYVSKMNGLRIAINSLCYKTGKLKDNLQA